MLTSFKKSRSVTPLTIKQLLSVKRTHSEAPFALDGRIMDWVSLVYKHYLSNVR